MTTFAEAQALYTEAKQALKSRPSEPTFVPLPLLVVRAPKAAPVAVKVPRPHKGMNTYRQLEKLMASAVKDCEADFGEVTDDMVVDLARSVLMGAKREAAEDWCNGHLGFVPADLKRHLV